MVTAQCLMSGNISGAGHHILFYIANHIPFFSFFFQFVANDSQCFAITKDSIWSIVRTNWWNSLQKYLVHGSIANSFGQFQSVSTFVKWLQTYNSAKWIACPVPCSLLSRAHLLISRLYWDFQKWYEIGSMRSTRWLAFLQKGRDVNYSNCGQSEKRLNTVLFP